MITEQRALEIAKEVGADIAVGGTSSIRGILTDSVEFTRALNLAAAEALEKIGPDLNSEADRDWLALLVSKCREAAK